MSEPPITFSQRLARQEERLARKDTYDQRGRISQESIFLDSESALRLISWNADSSLTLITCRIIIMRIHGGIDEVVYTQVPAADRSPTATVMDVGVGWVLSVFLFGNSGANQHGLTYCQIRTRNRKENIDFRILAQAYLTNFTYLSFPLGTNEQNSNGKGALRSITGTDPAAGAEVAETNPNGARRVIRAVAVSFVADANVANRTIELVFDDGTNEILRLQDRTVITAGQTRTVQAQQFAVLPADTTTTHYFVLPQDFEMRAGYRIRTETTNLQATDNYAAPTIIVEEWMD